MSSHLRIVLVVGLLFVVGCSKKEEKPLSLEDMINQIKVKDDRLIFAADIPKKQAQLLVDHLVKLDVFRGEFHLMKKDDGTYLIRWYAKEGAENDIQAVKAVELAALVSKDVFSSAPVEFNVHTHDKTLVETKQSWIVEPLTCAWDTGAFTHDFLLTNGSSSDLGEVDLVVTFTREDGERVSAKAYWASWTQKETRKVNVAAHRYQKMEVKGTAVRKGQKVRIDTYWTQRW